MRLKIREPFRILGFVNTNDAQANYFKIKVIDSYKNTVLYASTSIPVAPIPKSIVYTGLKLYVDFGNYLCYSGVGITATDLSGNGYTGTFQNGLTFSSSNSGILNFDGINDKLSFGDVLDLQGQDMSLEVWFKINTKPVSLHTLIDKFTGKGYRLFVGSSLGLGFQYRDVSGILESFGNYGPSPGVTTGIWYHCIVTHKNSDNTAKMYVNGQQAGGVTFTRIRAANPGTDLTLGYAPNNNAYLNGSIASAAIYDKVLTRLEVLNNYNVLKERFGL